MAMCLTQAKTGDLSIRLHLQAPTSQSACSTSGGGSPASQTAAEPDDVRAASTHRRGRGAIGIGAHWPRWEGVGGPAGWVGGSALGSVVAAVGQVASAQPASLTSLPIVRLVVRMQLVLGWPISDGVGVVAPKESRRAPGLAALALLPVGSSAVGMRRLPPLPARG